MTPLRLRRHPTQPPNQLHTPLLRLSIITHFMVRGVINVMAATQACQYVRSVGVLVQLLVIVLQAERTNTIEN
jgi:hypothetical protein